MGPENQSRPFHPVAPTLVWPEQGLWEKTSLPSMLSIRVLLFLKWEGVPQPKNHTHPSCLLWWRPTLVKITVFSLVVWGISICDLCYKYRWYICLFKSQWVCGTGRIGDQKQHGGGCLNLNIIVMDLGASEKEQVLVPLEMNVSRWTIILCVYFWGEKNSTRSKLFKRRWYNLWP